VVRRERPHVMTTYDENGGYPHPDHIRCHECRSRRSRRPAIPTASRRGRALAAAEAVLQPHLPQGRLSLCTRRCWSARSSRRTPSGCEVGRQAGGRGAADDVGRVRRLVLHPRRRAHRARHAGRPERPLVRLPDRPAEAGLADRGLPAAPARWSTARCPRTTCSPACASGCARDAAGPGRRGLGRSARAAHPAAHRLSPRCCSHPQHERAPQAHAARVPATPPREDTTPGDDRL
jgi:hypothetical protein